MASADWVQRFLARLGAYCVKLCCSGEVGTRIFSIILYTLPVNEKCYGRRHGTKTVRYSCVYNIRSDSLQASPLTSLVFFGHIDKIDIRKYTLIIIKSVSLGFRSVYAVTMVGFTVCHAIGSEGSIPESRADRSFLPWLAPIVLYRLDPFLHRPCRYSSVWLYRRAR